MVAAIQDGVVAVVGVVQELVVHEFRHHALGLVFVVAAGQHPHWVAEAVLTPQPLLEKVRVVGDECVGGLENAAGAAIVLFELDDLEVGVVVLELVQVLGARATPRVHRLIVITDHREPTAVADQQFHQFVLAGIRVLILVHQQVAHLLLPACAHLGVIAQQMHRLQDEIVEIERIEGLEAALVFGVHARGGGEQGVAVAPGRRLLGAEQRVLPGGYLPLHGFWRHALVAAQAFADEIETVFGIVDGEAWLVAAGREFLAQNSEAEGMEGGDREALGIRTLEQVGHAGFHFARGLVGEGDGGDARRLNAALLDEPGDLARDHRGLAAARAGQHQQRPVDVAYGFFLAGVEFGHSGRRMLMGRYCSGRCHTAKA